MVSLPRIRARSGSGSGPLREVEAACGAAAVLCYETTMEDVIEFSSQS